MCPAVPCLYMRCGARHGSGLGRYGEAGSAPGWHGSAWQQRVGWASFGMASFAWQHREGMAWVGRRRHGMAATDRVGRVR